MNKITKITTIALVCIMLVPLIAQAVSFTDAFAGTQPDPGAPRTDWYDVEDWEIAYCSAQGGLLNAVDTGSGQSSFVNRNLIAHVSGYKVNLTNLVTGSSQVYYEIGYFLQPGQTTENIRFDVLVIQEGRETSILGGEEQANYNNPKGDYLVLRDDNPYGIDMTRDITNITMTIEGQEPLTVAVILREDDE